MDADRLVSRSILVRHLPHISCTHSVLSIRVPQSVFANTAFFLAL